MKTFTVAADCPLCGAGVKAVVHHGYPETRTDPAEPPTVEDIIPSCGCSEIRCVDELAYFDMITEAILTAGADR